MGEYRPSWSPFVSISPSSSNPALSPRITRSMLSISCAHTLWVSIRHMHRCSVQYLSDFGILLLNNWFVGPGCFKEVYCAVKVLHGGLMATRCGQQLQLSFGQYKCHVTSININSNSKAIGWNRLPLRALSARRSTRFSLKHLPHYSHKTSISSATNWPASGITGPITHHFTASSTLSSLASNPAMASKALSLPGSSLRAFI